MEKLSENFQEYSKLQISIRKKDVPEIERLSSALFKSLQARKDIGSPPSENNVQILISVLQNIPSFEATKNVISILYHYTCVKSVKREALKLFVKESVVNYLFAAFVQYKESWSSCNIVTSRYHTLISKLAKREKKLCIMARLSGAAKVTVSLVKLPKSKFSAQCALLSCLKIFLSSSQTSSCLGKNDLLKTLLLNLHHVQDKGTFKAHLLITLSLECISLLLKLKVNTKKFVDSGGVQIVMDLLETWYKSESKIGRRLGKSCLMILTQSSDLNVGCQAIIECDGRNKLNKISSQLPSKREYVLLLNAIFCILVKCSPKIQVPAPLVSAVKFCLPNIPRNSIDQISSAGSDEDLSQESLFNSEETQEESEKLAASMKELTLIHEFPSNELTKFHVFFSERPCQHPSMMKGYPCCDSSLDVDNSYPEVPIDVDYPEMYKVIASNVKSVMRFVKVPYPELIGSVSILSSQSLLKNSDEFYRQRLLFEVDNLFDAVQCKGEVIYDLDAIVDLPKVRSDQMLCNDDENRIGQDPGNGGRLLFESRFECGNLRKVIKINQNVYDLMLSPDVNITGRHQWFYFEVSGMEKDVAYTFNIINCEKQNSQFNYGMQPLMFSVKESMEGRGGWRRIGSHICYHKNRHKKHTTTMTLKFPHSWDVCYLAYHFPYSYSRLQVELNLWSRKVENCQEIYFHKQKLAKSLGGNNAVIITITAKNDDSIPVEERPYILLSARVHPGESNSSWMMKGTVDFLLSEDPIAKKLRSTFIFKIIPMLNPDGVINGNQRCSLLGVDLNRCWSKPNVNLHPTIYHAKGLLAYLQSYLCQPPLAFIDYHGHSRKKNIFMFGCSPKHSWYPSDKSKENNYSAETFAKACSKYCKAFSYNDCNFVIEKSRESTARVTVWRTFCCKYSFTLESTYGGFNHGIYEGLQTTTAILEEMGSQLCLSFVPSSSSTPKVDVAEAHLNDKNSQIIEHESTRQHADSFSTQSNGEESMSSDISEDDDQPNS